MSAILEYPSKREQNKQPAPKPAQCSACALTRRPEFVPWQQHMIGCPVRERALTHLHT